VQAHLDDLLDMIARADMFAVITARTGPGRSDFTFRAAPGAVGSIVKPIQERRKDNDTRRDENGFDQDVG
jgi:hypothetical protein